MLHVGNDKAPVSTRVASFAGRAALVIALELMIAMSVFHVRAGKPVLYLLAGTFAFAGSLVFALNLHGSAWHLPQSRYWYRRPHAEGWDEKAVFRLIRVMAVFGVLWGLAIVIIIVIALVR